jgi:23S rRNA (guanine745-N1)-methyltransferase
LCPVCRQPLGPNGRVFQCASRHSFDQAKEGYLNLLLKRKFTGDTKPMLQARREFLTAGHYAPFADALVRMVENAIADLPGEYPILEVGCGEGYYLRFLAQKLPRNQNTAPQLWGFDVSRDAVALAAKAQPDAFFFVADVTQPFPIEARSLRAIVNLFAPHNFEEFERTLVPEGRLILGFPTARHMAEVRETMGLLEIDADKEAQLLQRAGTAWKPVDRALVEFPLLMRPEDIERFVTMSPNQWHRGAADQKNPGSVATRASFTLLALQR